MEYTVLLADGTVGIINLNGDCHPDDLIGEIVHVKLHDENGNSIKAEGELVECLTF